MTQPEPGDTFTYSAGVGLAARARVADPDVDDGLAGDMAELDLTPGTEVTIVGCDEERDMVLLDWTDAQGNPRTTSVTSAVFDECFSATEQNNAD
jgi:hypothetical protein